MSYIAPIYIERLVIKPLRQRPVAHFDAHVDAARAAACARRHDGHVKAWDHHTIPF